MKRKISLVLIGGALVAPLCFGSIFGEETIFLAQLVQQGIEDFQQAKQAIDNAKQAYAFVRSPTWRGVMDRAVGIMDEASSGSDSVTLRRYQSALKASREAYNQLSSEPTLQNVAALSELSLRYADAKQKADELAGVLQYQAQDEQLKQTGIGQFGCVSCSLGR